MGCGNSIAVTPEQQLKDEQRRKRKHAKVVSRSELLTLRMVEPKPGAVVEVRMMETVGVLLGRAAIKIGLEEWDGELLTMEYDGNVVDHAEMLKDIGIAEKGEFKVNGYQEAKVESAKRFEIKQAEAKKVAQPPKHGLRLFDFKALHRLLILYCIKHGQIRHCTAVLFMSSSAPRSLQLASLWSYLGGSA